MINDLNSILLEGVLVADPERITEPARFAVKFDLMSTRHYKDADDKFQAEHTFVYVVIRYGPLASKCLEVLKEKRGVRIVGRITQYENRIAVFAEHIEFKPVK